MSSFANLLCLVVFILAYACICGAIDHGARLDEIVNRKYQEAKLVHKRTEHLISQTKSRAETTGQVHSKSRFNSVTNSKDIHDQHINAIQRPNVQQEYSGTSKMHSTLSSHGVSSALAKEINNMASSFIPRETIVKHVQTHFPNKEPHEWNDIVISAISAAGKSQPNSLETNKAETKYAEFRKHKFDQAKETLQDGVNA